MLIYSSYHRISSAVKSAIILLIVISVAVFALAVKNSRHESLYFNEPVPGKVPPPVFSHRSGFHDGPFQLHMTHPNHAAAIYYTLDGSDPSWKSAIYNNPVVIKAEPSNPNQLSFITTSPRWKMPVNTSKSATVIKAIAVLPDSSVSETITNTFFVFQPDQRHYNLPVVSLITDPVNLFDYAKGIYILGKQYDDKDVYVRKNISLKSMWWDYPANYRMRGSDAERPVFIQLFDEKGGLQFEADAGLRIHGEATRAYSRKSLRIHFRKKYGLKAMHYRLFPDDILTTFHSIVLRNSGNDWDKTLFRDALVHALVKNAELDFKRYRPVIVFIDGEYWGIHFLSTYPDDNHLAVKYDINRGQILMVEGSGKLYRGKKENYKYYSELMNYINSHGLSVKANYDSIQKTVDLSNFTDYIITNVYTANTDWPYNNEILWRYYGTPLSGIKDGKWRWILTDFDFSFGYKNQNAYSYDMLEELAGHGSAGTLFGSLIQNDEYRDFFIKRFRFHLDHTFHPDTVNKLITVFEQMIMPEMEDHIGRWRKPVTLSAWKKNVEALRNFAEKRSGYLKTKLISIH